MRRLGPVLIAVVVSGCVGASVASTTTTSSTTTTTTTTSITVPPTTTTTLTPVSVNGSIQDAAGRPLVGAKVGFGGAVTFSGTDGSFSVSTVEPGPLTLSKHGWHTDQVPWEPTRDEMILVMEPKKVRGLRVGAGAAGDDAHFERLLDLADGSAINALVFDSKQEGGKVVYQTALTDAHRIGAVDVWYDPVTRIAQARERGLYNITRVVVFEDEFWASAHPEERLAGSWVHPEAPEARRYNIDLAVEACALGFDEVQFDYVRYPAGQTARVSGQLNIPQETRVAAIAGFLATARDALSPMGCAVSADIFGIVVSVDNDQGLGQRPEELSPHLDALSPMIYPSHYSSGWMGSPAPNDHPYAVTADAIDAARPRMTEGTALRPWLQAFSWDDSQIRESIQAGEDRGVGWILWNVGSSYSVGAIPGPDEVED